jgi:hypothetical protein
MRRLSNWDHCCGHSLKIDCSRHAFDTLFDDMPESSDRPYHADMIEARVNIVHPNPRSTSPTNA